MLIELSVEALRKRSAELDLEQAVYGLDALSEVEFHPLLAAAYEGAGLGVLPEHPYPGNPGKRPKHGERERCDLVVLPSRGTVLRDPVAVVKEADMAAGTLFASIHSFDRPAEPSALEPEEAFWLEVKLVGQFCYTAGIPGPNRTYSTELLRTALGDIPKLSRERRIRHAGLLLILFTADQPTADHDLAVMVHRCLDRNLPVEMPIRGGLPIPDRVGNTLCTLAILPVQGGTGI